MAGGYGASFGVKNRMFFGFLLYGAKVVATVDKVIETVDEVSETGRTKLVRLGYILQLCQS